MKNIVILTGAGISKESGVATFRDAGGLWTAYNPDEVMTRTAWKKNPAKVIEFKNMIRRDFVDNNYQPNAAHHALVKLEKEWAHGKVTIITQNIDGLHVMAGSTNVLDIHGNIGLKFCEYCGFESVYDADIVLSASCKKCGEIASTRPKIVMFEEYPYYSKEVQDCLSKCSIFAVIGSSLEVQPANGFGLTAKNYGSETTLINLEPPARGDLWHWDLRIYGPATLTVPVWVDKILANNP